MNPTIENISAFMSSLEARGYYDDIDHCRRRADVIAAHVAEYTMKIFSEFKFTAMEEFRALAGDNLRIESPADLWMCGEKDNLAAFYARCDAAHIEHGYTPGKGCSPALMAASRLANVESELIGRFCAVTGFPKPGIAYRGRMLNLILSGIEKHMG